jgi:hypothetical protein
MIRYYAGIGSRSTPFLIKIEMAGIARELASRNFVLRSGNADGADQAFAYGVGGSSAAQIWLPWDTFNYSFTKLFPHHNYKVIESTDEEAANSVYEFHPKPNELTDRGMLFMARNFRQVIGKDEDNSSFIVCWTRDGKASGGTGQALRIAKKHNIPIINMFDHPTKSAVLDKLSIWYDI